MGKVRTFRDDSTIKDFLDAIPKNEFSATIRMAIRQYFRIGQCVQPPFNFEILEALELESEDQLCLDDWR